MSRARFRSLTRFVANSKNVAQSLIDGGFPAERISIVNEGVEIPNPVPSGERNAARKEWGIAEDEFLFGCAGAFVPEKGQRHIVQALRIVKDSFPKTRLLLAGEGHYLDDVRQLVYELGLQRSVSLPGFVRNMPRFYAALDAFLFPSEFEGLGTALQSAMAYGLPSISTTRGALGEVVEDGHNAIVAEPSGESFASAMIALLSRPELRSSLGTAARTFIQEQFSADRMVENTLLVYEQVVQGEAA